MPELILGAIATEGFLYLTVGALLAGIVRGFPGFGTAMVYMPIAASVLGPFEALTSLLIKDLTAPLIHVPRALRDGHPADVLRLGIGALVAVPLGVWVLSLVSPDVFRWGLSLAALILLALLAAGIRYRGKLTRGLVYATGALGGFMAGCTGLPGPPVILMYMASTLPAAVVRANLTLYLMVADLILLGVLAWNGFLASSAVVIGCLMILPYLLGNWLGALMFRPEAEVIYRRVAYGIIVGSAILGMPIWD